MSDNDSVVNNETVVEVDVSTDDDLDAFTAEFFGRKPKESEPEKVEEEVSVDNTDNDVEETDAEAEPEQEETEEEEDEEPTPEVKKPNRKTAKERISELSAERRADKAEIAALKAQLANKDTPTPKVEEKKTSQELADGRPDPEAKDENGDLKYPLGKFDPEFAADNVRWTMKVEREQAAAAARAEAEENAKQAEARELVERWEDKLVATEEDVPDLRQKIAVLEDSFIDVDPMFGNYLVETIMTLDRGPEVLLYLADNISEAEAIVASSPRAATIALGQIHGRLPSKIAEPRNEKKVSKAPNPPALVRGNGAASRVSADTDNLEDFEKLFFKK